MQKGKKTFLLMLCGLFIFAQIQSIRAQENDLNVLNYQIQEVKAKIQDHPNDEDLYLALGYLYALNNCDEEATEAFEKSLELNPENPRTYYFLAEFYYTRGKLKKGKEYIKKALEFDPNNKSYLAYFGLILAGVDEMDKAIAIYEKLFPDSGGAVGLYYLASLYEENKDLEKAILFYEKAAKNSPDSINIYEKLVYLYDEKGDMEKLQDILLTIQRKDKRKAIMIKDSLSVPTDEHK